MILPLVCMALAGPASAGFAGAASVPLSAREGEEAAAGEETASSGEAFVDELLAEASIDELVLELAREVEAIRGKAFTCLPSVRLASRSRILERARERLAERLRPHVQEVEENCAKLLGMLPGDVDLASLRNEFWSSQYDGFFDAESCVLWVAREIDASSARLQLVNGLAQILDDQHHALETSLMALSDNGDARLALRAVSLGSAAMVEEAWKLRNARRLTSRERRQSSRIFELADLGRFPPYVWKPLLIAATRGSSFLRRSGVPSIMLQGVRARDVDRALADLPTSTEQVLHPVKYWKGSRADSPRTMELDLDGLPAGWEVLREDTLGELRLGILLEAAGVVDGTGESSDIDSALTYVPSEGWGGDRYVLLHRAGAWVLHLATVWDELSDAREAHDALRSAQEHLLDNLKRMPADAAAGERGVSVRFGSSGDVVLLTSWIGLRPEEAAELEACIGAQPGPPDRER